eukprot:jgi/Tetstr1/463206/TSEL_008138.t1
MTMRWTTATTTTRMQAATIKMTAKADLVTLHMDGWAWFRQMVADFNDKREEEGWPKVDDHNQSRQSDLKLSAGDGACLRPSAPLRGIACMIAELDDPHAPVAPAASAPATDNGHDMRVYPRRRNGKTKQARCRLCLDRKEECYTTRYCAKCNLDLCVPSNDGATRDCWGAHLQLAPSEILRWAPTKRWAPVISAEPTTRHARSAK